MPNTRPVSGMPVWYLRLSHEPTVRLLLVPVIVYIVWLFEIYLLAGRPGLFSQPEAAGLYLYTLLGCLAIGTIVPLFLLRKAFIQGHVTMFQLGFRSWYRTVAGIVFAFLVIGGALTLYNPCGKDPSVFFLIFLLLLPTGIASVMICWVLTGTHVQALVQSGGPVISIPVGVTVTAILFGLSLKAQFPISVTPDVLFWQIITGMVMAAFYFLVRDVWPTTVLVTGELVYLVTGWMPVSGLMSAFIPIVAAASVSTGALLLVHWFFIRHFRTIPAPAT